jgi:hypothetical protein
VDGQPVYRATDGDATLFVEYQNFKVDLEEEVAVDKVDVIGSGESDWTIRVGNQGSIQDPICGLPPTSDRTSMVGLTGTGKWSGGVLAGNGKIYFTPRNAEEVLIIDPATDTYDRTTMVGLTGSRKWSGGGVLAGNGKIYLAPYDAEEVLIIDPATDTYDRTTMVGLTGTGKWSGGVLAGNGKIYLAPYTAEEVLIIDPATDTYDRTTMVGLGVSFKWSGGVLGGNGKIYLAPYDAEEVLIINPATNTYDRTTMVGLTGTGKWVGGVLAGNGKIYLTPHEAEEVLIIDPATDTYDRTTMVGLTGGVKWGGGALAGNGKIYLAPRNAEEVLIIDPITDTYDRTILVGLTTSVHKWVGGVLGAHGNIYFAPRDAEEVIIIHTNPVEATGEWVSVDCPGAMRGRFITIWSPSSMAISEVAAFSPTAVMGYAACGAEACDFELLTMPDKWVSEAAAYSTFAGLHRTAAVSTQILSSSVPVELCVPHSQRACELAARSAGFALISGLEDEVVAALTNEGFVFSGPPPKGCFMVTKDVSSDYLKTVFWIITVSTEEERAARLTDAAGDYLRPSGHDCLHQFPHPTSSLTCYGITPVGNADAHTLWLDAGGVTVFKVTARRPPTVFAVFQGRFG